MTRAALDWGIRIAKDDSHGYYKYIEGKRWGPYDYDCASFAVCMFADGAGLPIPHGPNNDDPIVVSTMYNKLRDYGFEKVNFDNDCSKLQPGDILVINPDGETAHAEVYMGDGVVIHATDKSFYDDDQEPGDGDDMEKRLRDHAYVANPDSDEDTSGKTYLDNYCEDFNRAFETNITPDNHTVDGIPFVGEISGYRIAKPGCTEYIDEGGRGPVAYVLRYTGGIPVDQG